VEEPEVLHPSEISVPIKQKHKRIIQKLYFRNTANGEKVG
jgi:hypothetical protein